MEKYYRQHIVTTLEQDAFPSGDGDILCQLWREVLAVQETPEQISKKFCKYIVQTFPNEKYKILQRIFWVVKLFKREHPGLTKPFQWNLCCGEHLIEVDVEGFRDEPVRIFPESYADAVKAIDKRFLADYMNALYVLIDDPTWQDMDNDIREIQTDLYEKFHIQVVFLNMFVDGYLPSNSSKTQKASMLDKIERALTLLPQTIASMLQWRKVMVGVSIDEHQLWKAFDRDRDTLQEWTVIDPERNVLIYLDDGNELDAFLRTVLHEFFHEIDLDAYWIEQRDDDAFLNIYEISPYGPFYVELFKNIFIGQIKPLLAAYLRENKQSRTNEQWVANTKELDDTITSILQQGLGEKFFVDPIDYFQTERPNAHFRDVCNDWETVVPPLEMYVRPRGFVSLHATHHEVEDQAEIAEELLIGNAHMLDRCKIDTILRQKVEIMTWCKFSEKEGKFSRWLTNQERKELTWQDDFLYFRAWAPDECTPDFWNERLHVD